MAAEVSVDLSIIQDEDVLRKMWQQTEDFGRKKEIRQRMYKLREQRLKDFYTTGEVVSDTALTTLKHTATKHADSIADQGFMSMKTKEIRDSESPTRDIHRRMQAENNYWNTVQESYSTSDQGGNLVESYQRQMAGKGVSPDGRTQSQSAAEEKNERSSYLDIKDDSTKQEERLSHSGQASMSSRTKTDDGEVTLSATKQEDQQKSSSYSVSKSGNTTSYSTSKQESSSSSSSSRQVVTSSSSSTYKVLPSGEKVLVSTTTSSDLDGKALTGTDDNFRQSTTSETSDHKSSNRISSRNQRISNTEFINNESYNNVSATTDLNDSQRFITSELSDSTIHDAQTSRNQTVRRDDNDELSTRQEIRTHDVVQSEVDSSRNVDQKIMTELQKLDSYLSTQNTTGTTTPVSPHSVTGDAANWTVVSSNNGEFVYKSDNEKTYSPSERPGLIKHPSSLDLPKEPTEGQYITTYQQSYQPKRISVEHSPTHDAFARSLRSSPPPSTTHSSSKGSLDRASPERKYKPAGSPTRSSPEKERRVSVAGSYTIEKPKEPKRKTSETVKSKRKFSTTQTKANTKVRASTPGTSPSTSPTRMERGRTTSASSDSESDSSQLTYTKHTSTIRRKETTKTTDVTKGSYTSPVRSSPERSPQRKSPSPTKTTGILRKDSKTATSPTTARTGSPVKEKSKSPSLSPERNLKKSRESPVPKINVSRETTDTDSNVKTQQKVVSDKLQSVDDVTSKPLTNEIIQRKSPTTDITGRKVNQFSNTTVQINVITDDSTDTLENTIDDTIIDKSLTTNSTDDLDQQSVEKDISIKQSNTNITEDEDSKFQATHHNVNIDTKHAIKTETTEFIVKERQDNKSPSPMNIQREKSPEYSSEGSVSKEIKSLRSGDKIPKESPDSSPERSAFKPIKSFRANPEFDKIGVKIQDHGHPTGAPSPVSPKPQTKDNTKTKSPVSQKSRESTPTKSPSRSAPKNETKSPVRESKSSSISPYSSPERRTPVKDAKSPSVSPERKISKIAKSPSASPERKPDKVQKATPQKKASVPQQTPEKPADKSKPDNFRTTRRSSIPRAEVKQKELTKKVSEKKIEIKPKPGTNVRVNSFENKKPIQKAVTTRTSSQGSITRQTVTKTFKTTAVREVKDKSITKTPSATRIKSTAVIHVNKPNSKVPSTQPSAKIGTNTVINITISPKTQKTTTTVKTTKSDKKPTENKSNVLKDRNIIRKETVTQKKTNKTVISHRDDYDGSSDRSTSVSSPETVRPIENVKNVTSNVAISLICSSGVTSKQLNESNRYETNEQDDTDNLENEMPPEEFNVDDDDDFGTDSPSKVVPQKAAPKPKEKPVTPKQAPSVPKKPFASNRSSDSIKTSSKTDLTSKGTTVKKTTQNIALKQKLSNDNLKRTQSDKSIGKTTINRSTNKQDLKQCTVQVTRTSSAKKITTETGVATKHITTPKSTTIKKTQLKKKPVDIKHHDTSSSSDEETEVDIPCSVNVITQDEQYINELEDLRRAEEQEYAAKLTATTTQEDSLLNVIIQHPKSSRESSPGYTSQDQPYCTVSDDGGAHPRYADLISEPEDVEVFNIPGKRPTEVLEAYEPYTGKPFEQVTDLDEVSENEEKLNISVADRVSQFLVSSEEAKTVKVSSTFKENADEPSTEGPKAVLKAKAMFETIAKNQTAPPAPNNKPVDILNRPSVFEGRKGIVTKEKFETFPRRKSSESPEPVKRTSSTNEIVDNKSDIISTSVNVTKQFTSQKVTKDEVDESIKKPIKQKSPSPVRESKPVVEKPITKPVADKPASPSRKDSERRKSLSPVKDVQTKPANLKDTGKKPVSDSTKLIAAETNEFKKTKTVDVNTKQNSEISSKRDFFERKAKFEQTTTKSRQPIKELPTSLKNKVSDSRNQTTDFIQNERTSSSPRTSPERKVSSSPARKPEVGVSTTVTQSKTKTTDITTKRKISSESPERKPTSPTKDKVPKRAGSPTKDIKESSRSSPEKQLPNKDRKESLTKQKSPERQVRKDFPKEKSPEKFSGPSKDKKASSPERSVPKDRRSSLKQSSPDRKTSSDTKTENQEYARKDSLERGVIEKHGDVVELNRAGRFGVTLRRTSSTTSAGTPRRTSLPGGDEIEDIFQLELLEQMLEKVVGYEQRRRIRAQIRVVKKLQEDARSARKSSRSPVKEIQPQRKRTPEPETKKPSAPEQKPVTTRPQSPTKSKLEPQTKSPTIEPKPLEVKKSSVTPKKDTSPVRQQQEVIRKSSKTETSTTTSTVRTPAREREPCPITSSYGVGPTDENGRPLFGLKALRRSNTNKTLTDEVVEKEHREQHQQQQEVEVTTESEQICDARGRPLFGLKALQVSSVDTQEMPEVSSEQLRGLVQRHEQHAKEHSNADNVPRQKPKAKLRDSFILQSQDEESAEETHHESKTTALNRGGVSLRSLIQKHEDISSTGGNVHREMESKTTVVTSRSTVRSDGSVSLSQDILKGELSSKNGEEPSGKVTHTKYSYQTPDDKVKTQGVTSSTTTTTMIGGRRSSGPKITEIEDSEERRSSITSETSSRRFSGTKLTDFEEKDQDNKKTSASRRLSQDIEEVTANNGSNLVSSAIKKFSGSSKVDDDERLQKKSTTVSSAKFISSTSSSVRKSNLSNSSTASSSPVNDKVKAVSSPSPVQKSSSKVSNDDDRDSSSDDKKKNLVRGDSIRALQHKFQQATVSSSLKQHSSTTVDSSTKHKQSQSSQSAVSPNSRLTEKVSDKSVVSNDGSVTTTTRTSQVMSTSTGRVSTEKSSFLDNTTKVSGVQDILNRMRNADLVVEPGDSNEDQEARALLNKFLGASVILQGMEQGMKAHRQQQLQTNGHHQSLPASPTSAALVSRVEKQRMASVTTQQEIEDLESIWDEQQLRNLLEDCTDYDGRRKIRARLRNVMAEHKACADLVAVTPDATGNSMISQECVESKQISTKVEDSSYSHSEVHTRTSASFSSSHHHMTKSNSVTSPFQKFKQLERQNSAPSRASNTSAPLYKFTDPKLARSASSIKDRLLSWVQAQTKDYKNIQIDNFSTSWSNGLAFCALIHHFCPEAFDYDKLTPDQRRHNFELAFRVAEEEADIAPLLDVEDMVMMRRPDWKCVFTYVQSVYRRFHATPEAIRQ